MIFSILPVKVRVMPPWRLEVQLLRSMCPTTAARLDGTIESENEPSADARKYVLGGVGQPGRRWYQRDPQEVLYGLLQGSGGGGAAGGTGDSGGGGGNGSSPMERVITALLAMQLM